MYTPIDMIEMLDMIHEGNRTVGGLSMTAKGYGIVGFVRFLDCYYLNFITQRRLVRSPIWIGASCKVRGGGMQYLFVGVMQNNFSRRWFKFALISPLDIGGCNRRQPRLRYQSYGNVCHQAR